MGVGVKISYARKRAGVYKWGFWPHLQNCPFYPFMVVLNVSYAKTVFLIRCMPGYHGNSRFKKITIFERINIFLQDLILMERPNYCKNVTKHTRHVYIKQVTLTK